MSRDVLSAAETLVATHPVRALDAVHIASAQLFAARIALPDLIFVSADAFSDDGCGCRRDDDQEHRTLQRDLCIALLTLRRISRAPGSTSSSGTRSGPSCRSRSGPLAFVVVGRKRRPASAAVLLRLVRVVRATPQCEIRDRRDASHGIRDEVMELEEAPLRAAAPAADKRALGAIALPHSPSHRGRNVP